MTKRALKIGKSKLQQTITEKRDSRRAKENVTPVKLKKKRTIKSSARKSIRKDDSQKAFLLKRINEIRNIKIHTSKSSKMKNSEKSDSNSFDNSLSTNNSIENNMLA